MLQPRDKLSGKLQDPGRMETVLPTCAWTDHECAALCASNVCLEANKPLCDKREERAVLIEMVGSEAMMCIIRNRVLTCVRRMTESNNMRDTCQCTCS